MYRKRLSIGSNSQGFNSVWGLQRFTRTGPGLLLGLQWVAL